MVYPKNTMKTPLMIDVAIGHYFFCVFGIILKNVRGKCGEIVKFSVKNLSLLNDISYTKKVYYIVC